MRDAGGRGPHAPLWWGREGRGKHAQVGSPGDLGWQREGNPLPGPQAAFAQIWDSVYVRPSAMGSRHASRRNGWFCWWWTLSSEVPSFHACFRPRLLSLSLPVSPLPWPLEHGPACCSHPCPWLLAPLPWGLGSHPLPALAPVILAAHITSRPEVLCLAAARPRQQ